MKVNVKLFASAREAVGLDEIQVLLPNKATFQDFLQVIHLACPQLQGMSGRYVVNQTVVTKERMIEAGDEIAFLPPVSGG